MSNDPSAQYTYVCVPKTKGKGGKATDEWTKVKHEHYMLKSDLKKVTSYEEAMMDQCSDIDYLLNKVVKKMAECEMVDGKGTESCKIICKIVADRLSMAVARQNTKGHTARWRRVRWKPSA
jgi:hypothetical protein